MKFNITILLAKAELNKLPLISSNPQLCCGGVTPATHQFFCSIISPFLTINWTPGRNWNVTKILILIVQKNFHKSLQHKVFYPVWTVLGLHNKQSVIMQ